MNFVSKFFDQLTSSEVYEILKARTKIFIVEQNCPYQDSDGTDYESLHVFYEQDGEILAYLRAFVKEKGVVQVGRVLTVEHGKGLGGKLLKEGLEQVKEKYAPQKIYLEAQCYATGFYEREGFKICSDVFLEDGIPHVKMELEL